MSRRLSSHEASEATGAEPQRGRGSRCSLGYPNSSLSPWYTSSRNGVSLGSITITSPCQPLSVSGSVSGISYPTCVSSSIIPRTQTRLISASASGGGRLIRGGGADSMPRVCRPLRVGTDTAITGNEELFQLSVRVVPSHGRLAQSRSSSCGGGHAFLRHTSRISVRVGPRTSNPVVAERMRIADSLRRQASVGRRGTNRTLFVPAEASESAERAEQRSTTPPSVARTIEFKHLDVPPRVFTSVQTDVTRPLGVMPARSTSSPEEVGRALFSDWANRKQEMFADVFKGRKEFFADLLKLRHDEGHQPTARAQKMPTADSSRSEPFMTTISEMVEKDVPETSVENDTVHSAIGPTKTARMTAIEEKAPLQAVTASKKLYLTSSEFDSYDLSKTADSITQAREALSDGVSKETLQDKADSRGEKHPEYMSCDSKLKETETVPEVPRRDQGGFEEVKGTSFDLLIPKAESEDKMEVPLELVPSEQQLQDTKAMTVTQLSSLWSVEPASARAEVPTEASGYSYVPALAESTFEAPGATSEEHQVMPASFEGPFASMASDMTDFPALELSKTQEPDVSRQLPSLREPDLSEAQTQLVERPKMDDSAQLQVADTFHQLGASGARHPSHKYDTLLPLESTATIEQAATEERTQEIQTGDIIPMQPHQGCRLAVSEQTTVVDVSAFEKHDGIQLKGDNSVDVAEEHLLSRGPQKESEVRDVVPRQVDQCNKLISSESYVAVHVTTAEQHDNIPLTESTKKPTDEEYLAKQERDKETQDIVVRYPEQDSEIISSEQALLSDVNVALQHDHIMPQTRIVASAADENDTIRTANESELRDIVPRQEDQCRELASTESSAVVEVKPTEKHEYIQFAEPTTEPTSEEYLAKQEQDKETRDIVAWHPLQDSELISSGQAPLSGVSATQQHYDSLIEQSGAPAADENLMMRETPKSSELHDIVSRQEYEGSEPASSESYAVVEVKEIEKHESGPFAELTTEPTSEEYLEKQKHESDNHDVVAWHPEQDGEQISSEQAPLYDVSAIQKLDDALLQQSSASAASENLAMRETEKAGELHEIVPRQENQDSEPEPAESSAVVEVKETEKHESGPFIELTTEPTSEEYLEKHKHESDNQDVVAWHPEQDGELISSEQAPLYDVSATQKLDDALRQQSVAPAAGENLALREKAGELHEIVPRQEYQDSEPESEESSAVVEVKETEKHESGPFAELTSEPTSKEYLEKQKHENDNQGVVEWRPEQDSELISQEQAPLYDASATQKLDDALLPQSGAPAADENLAMRGTEKAGELHEIVPRQGDQDSEPESEESSAVVEVKETEKHEGVPFAELTTEPTSEEYLEKQKHENNNQGVVEWHPEQDSELISQEQAPLYDASATQKLDDALLPQSGAPAADENLAMRGTEKAGELHEIVPRQGDQDSEPESEESFAVVEVKETEKHEAVPFAELTTEPTSEEYLEKQKPKHENDNQGIVQWHPEQDSELISQEQAPLYDASATQKLDDALLPQSGAPAADENLAMKETETAGELHEIVPRQEDQDSEPESAESSAVVEVKETEKHEGIPFAELTTEPTDEDFLGRRGPEKQTRCIVPRPPQQGEIVSTEPTPLSDVSATQQLDDVLLQQSGAPAADENLTIREAAKVSELHDIVPRQEGQGSEPASSESSAVVEVNETEKHEGIPFSELATEPTDEDFLGRRGPEKQTRYIVPRPPQQGEIVSTEPTPLSDVSATQHTDEAQQSSTPAADENLTQRETAKESELTDMVPRAEDQGGGFVSSERTEVVEVSASDIAEPIEDDVATATDEYSAGKEKLEVRDLVLREPDQTYKSVFSERSTVADIAALEEPEDIKLVQPSAASDIREYILARQEEKTSDGSDLVARDKERTSELVPSYPIGVVEASTIDRYKGQQLETSMVPIPLDEIHESTSSTSLEPAGAATIKELERRPLTEPNYISAVDDYSLMQQPVKVSEVQDIVARQLDESSDLVLSENTQVVGMKEAEQREESQSTWQITEYAFPKELKEGPAMDAVTKEPQKEEDIAHSVMIPSTLETSQAFPAIEYLSTPVAETSKLVTASIAAPLEQALMTKSHKYPTDASAEAVLQEKEQPAVEGPVNYGAQLWDSETMKLALTNVWTPESGTVLVEDVSPGKDIVEVMDIPQVPTAANFDGLFSHSEFEHTSMEASDSGAVFVGAVTSGSIGTARDTTEVVKETPASKDKDVVDYAAQFWDSEAIKLQLTNMWTPEGGAVVVEDIQADIMVPDRVAALSDQYSVAQTQPTGSWASPSKEVPGDTLVPLRFDELPDSPVEKILLEPGYFKRVIDGEVLGGLELRPQEREGAPTDKQADSGDIEALPDERPITSGQEGGMFHMESEGRKAADAPFGGVVAISADMGVQPQPALPTLVEHPEYLGHEKEAIEEHSESAVAEVLPAGRPTAISGQEDALGLEFPSKETTGEPIASAEEEMISPVNVLPELTWSVTSDRPTEHPEREPDATEETTAAAEPDFTVQQPKKVEEIKRTASDLVGDKFDSAANEERGPLLSITRMEKHSCEKTSERILKRYGDTKPMESVTEAHESFVIAETETQFFGAETRESIMRTAPEKARTEAECSQSKFEPDVFLSDLIGKNGIEPTEPSQPCDYIARPLNIFDDVVGAAATSTTEAVSWKQSPSEDAVIKTESEGTKESGPYCREKEAVDYDNASDHINRVDEVSEGASLRSPSDPFSSPKSSPLATFSPFPEAEFTSLTNQGQYVPRPTFDLENRGTKLLACTKESDFTIRTLGDSECQSSLSAESNSSLDVNVLRTLHKPPLRFSGGGFQQQLVNVSALSVPLGKRAFPDVMLPYNIYKSPFHSVSSASELDSTNDKDFSQKTGEIPENLFDAPSAKPTGEVQADATYVSLTESNVNISPLADAGEQLPNCEATLNENEPGFQLDVAAYQQELPEVEDIAVVEAQGQYVHSEAVSSAQRTDLEPVSVPFDKIKVNDDGEQLVEEQSRYRVLEADCASLFYTEALSDEQAKLHAANVSLQTAFAPFKIGTPPLGTPPLATPPVGTSPAMTPITRTLMSEPPVTSDGQYAGSAPEVNELYYEYTTPFKTVTGQEPSKDHTAPVCGTEYSAQARSTDREPCYSSDKTIPSVPVPYETDMTKHEATTPSGQAQHQQPTFSFTEGKRPFSVAGEDSNRPGFAADLHNWFRTEDAATAKYPISVQAETSNEDSSGIEFPPWPSHSETELEKVFHAVDVPVAAPNREDAKKNFAVPSLLQELEGPFVFDPTDKDDGVENTRECIHMGGVSETDQGTVVASLNSILDPAEPQKSGLAISAGTDGAGKTKIQKRRLSFSDEVTASDDATFREKHKLLVGYTDVGSRADASPSENAARPSRKQPTYIYLAGATIPEEEYSLDKHELSAALESDTSAKADEEELMLPYNVRQSEPDDELNNDEHRAGSTSQYGEHLASTFTQSAPNDATAATNATWSAENRDDDLQRPVYVETGFEDARRQVNKSWLSLRSGSADYSNEQVENTCGGETAFGDRRANATEVGDNTWESSTREFESSVPTGAATSDPVGAGGVPSTERKASLSSVSVGYTQEPQPNDGNASSYSGNASDDLESLKMRLFGTRSRSQGPGDTPDDEIQKSEPTSTLSASHIVATDAPFPWEHTRSVDSETGYAPAIILKDDAYQMSLPGSAVTEGVADVANKYEVPAAEKETTKSESALSPTFGDVLNAEEGATRRGEEQPGADITTRAAPIQLEPSRRGGSESPTSDDGEGRMELLLKTAGSDRKDNAHDISREVPDADDDSPKLASHCEELRFENFRTVVEHMADLSARSETNIVYESFVPAIGKVNDMLGSVYYDTAFTVRVVDDYDLPSVMYDRWNEDAASVAPTIKTFWTYSPQSVLMSVDENGTHCGIISAIVFEDEQAFCAANSVKCDFLANGVKRQLWDALLSVQRGKNLFTVVPAEQVSAYYRHLGFYTSARGLILHGKLASDTDLAPLGQVPLPDDVEIVKFKKQMYPSLLSFDKSTLGFGRKRFWRMTLREGPISFRVALRGGSKGQVCGYAGLQNDVSGVPVVRWLVAADEHVAVRLLHNLLAGSFTFRQRGAWMALYARSHASAALLRHLDTRSFQPWMLIFNRREPFLQYRNIAVLTYI